MMQLRHGSRIAFLTSNVWGWDPNSDHPIAEPRYVAEGQVICIYYHRPIKDLIISHMDVVEFPQDWVKKVYVDDVLSDEAWAAHKLVQ